MHAHAWWINAMSMNSCTPITKWIIELQVLDLRHQVSGSTPTHFFVEPIHPYPPSYSSLYNGYLTGQRLYLGIQGCQFHAPRSWMSRPTTGRGGIHTPQTQFIGLFVFLSIHTNTFYPVVWGCNITRCSLIMDISPPSGADLNHFWVESYKMW